MPCSNCKFAREYELHPEVETETVTIAPFLFGKSRQVEIIKRGSHWDRFSDDFWTVDEVKEMCRRHNRELESERACCLNPEQVTVKATYECSHYQENKA